MNDTLLLTKIEMANLVFNQNKKNKIKDILCNSHGATDVTYKDMSYGICIQISGTESFRFVRDAILKELNIEENTLSILTENKKTLSATYVYLPDKDKNLNKKLKKLNQNKI